MAAEPLPLPIDDGPGLSLVPEYPAGVPVPDPPIIVIGRDLHQTWNRVYGFVKSIAKPFIDQAADTDVARAIDLIVPIIEAFVGTSQKVLGGYINDVGGYAAGGLFVLGNELGQTAQWAWRNLNNLEASLYGAVVHINALEAIQRALEAAIADAYTYAHDYAHSVGLYLEQWTMDHIYDPLIDDLGHLNRALVTYIDAKAAAVVDGLSDLMNSRLAEVAEVLGPLAVAVGALEKFKDECAQPMCDYAGPNTDLGKLMKAFQLAGILALLMEIGNMTEADVEARLRELAGDAQHIVSAFEGTFVGGGGSLRDFALGLL